MIGTGGNCENRLTSKRAVGLVYSGPEPRASGTRGARRGSFGPAVRWAIRVSIAAALVVSGSQQVSAQVAGVGHSVCDRTYQVSDAIVTASGAATCAHITSRHLREITSLDLRGQGIASVNVGDFDGLVRLHTLDLSDNILRALPQGVFDQLLLLRTLRLNGNLLQTLPANLFDTLFMLEELTLHGNPLLVLPAGMFADSLRDSGLADSVDLPPWGLDAGFLESFLNGAQTVEQFIAGLPALYKERFVMVYRSESPAQDHVSGEYPRIVSWGGDGRFIFSWNTDPATPVGMRDVVEFLRRGDTQWSAGMIDFSGATPTVTEPDSCRSCHGPLNKPLWGAYVQWDGTEYVHHDQTAGEAQAYARYTQRAVESTDPRIEPLDFSLSHFPRGYQARFLKTPGRNPYVAAAEEAGNVMAWRHAEVLFRRLKDGEDFRRFAERTVCSSDSHDIRTAALRPFALGDHNPAILSNTGKAVQGGSIGHSLVTPDYHYHGGGRLGGALVFLLVVDLWEQEPIVRGLYRQVPNGDTVPGRTGSFQRDRLLYYKSGSATAEDELIAKLRLHFGNGNRRALEDRARQNQPVGGYIFGPLSANFSVGHLEVMAPRVCRALTKTRPRNLEVTLTDNDAVLSWDAPEDISAVASFSGYRILRGVDGETPTVLVADTATTETTWTENGLVPGDYVWIVQALFDGYPSPESNAARETVSESGLAIGSPTAFTIVEGNTEIWTLSATGTDSAAVDLAWSITGGADRAHFTVAASGLLAFTAAKDYEAPDDTGGDGTYDLTVRVSDGTDVATAGISVSLSNRNEAPTADAGADQAGVEEGATVTLSGSGQDPDAGDTLQYAWTQTGGATVTLSAPAAAETTFAAPTGLTEDAVLAFTLQVTDAGSLTGDDEVAVTVVAGESQGGPEVVAPTSFTVVEGETAVGTLRATDPDTPAADLVWSIGGGADSGHFALSAGGVLALAAAKDYEAPDDTGGDGTYDLTVQVSDGADDATAGISVSLSNRNEAPTADAGADQAGVAEGATVTLSGSGRDPDAGDTLQYAWTQTGGAAVTLSAPSAAVTTFAAPTGLTEDAVLAFTLRVTDAGSLSGEDRVTVTVVAPEPPEGPALTASFHDVPSEHDGTNPFAFELRFSEEVDLSYVTLRDSAFTVTNGRVIAAWRVDRASNQRWGIRVEPSAAENITIVLPGGRACDAAGAICTADGRPLTGSVQATVEATDSSTPLTASFHDVPSQHDGTNPFAFELRFSEEVDVSYVTLRDSAFTVTNGRVIAAWRVDRSSNQRWGIRVEPTSVGDITILLPGGRACNATGAVCTAGDKRLSNSPSATVR